MCELLPDKIVSTDKFNDFLLGEPRNFNVEAVYKRLTGKRFDKLKANGKYLLNPALRNECWRTPTRNPRTTEGLQEPDEG
ncbi:hypothetical protein M569_09815 [Genlisea aurea]|uniref:Uncharacterized protein n=1 Tax=Genlisea aurea TaxID=192259 RepID=S8CDD2_9LAMI|nr:hypothetical protein M569_09815 [Genlisea aurea]